MNTETNWGWTPLHIASSKGHSKIVFLLVQNVARLEERTKRGETPLYIAAKKGHLSIVKYFLERGANINTSNIDGL